MKKIRALVLFSGGLDSILTVKLLQEQQIKIMGLTFASYFFDAGQAKKAAWQLRIPLRIIDFSRAHLKIVQNPRYGWGRGMNPCVDCHVLMLKQAKKIMKQEGFDFVATGEVLGERPLSQTKQALELIKRKSGLGNHLLRPLSALVLKETIPEKRGWVKRERFLAISGRSRKVQIALAKKYRIKEYPTPAGGCLLCDQIFSQKLESLLDIAAKNKIRLTANDFSLLKIGRHFPAKTKSQSESKPGAESDPSLERAGENGIKIVLGRNQNENLKLRKLASKKDIFIEPQNFFGPSALIRVYKKGRIRETEIEKARNLIRKYASKAKNKKIKNKKQWEFKILKL